MVTPTTTEDGIILLVILPVMVVASLLSIATATAISVYSRIHTHRYTTVQARLLARSGLDIKTTIAVPVQALPTRWENDTLIALSTPVSVDVVGEIRLIHCPSDWIAIGRYRGGIAVIRETVGTPSVRTIVYPN